MTKVDSLSAIPEGFRRAKRWRLVFKIWGLTTLGVGTISTFMVWLIEMGFVKHLLRPTWQIVVVMFCIVAVSSVPIALRVLREYPGPQNWR